VIGRLESRRTVGLLLLTVLALVATTAPAAANVTEFTKGISAYAGPDQIVTGPDGALWFTESGTGMIGRASTAGQITEFGGINSTRVTGIALGPDGNLWFTYVDGIGRITPAGQVSEYPGQNTWPGENEAFITTGPDGQLWFTERPDFYSGVTSEVAHATTSGQWSAAIPIPGNPILYGIAAAPDGNVWFLQDSPAGLGRITPAGQVTQFLSGFSPSDTLAGLTVGADGALWFLDSTSASLGRITTAGELSWFHLPVKAAPPWADHPQPTLTSLTSGPGGNLWFTSLDGLLGRFSPSSGKAVVTGKGLSSAPLNIASGPDGNLWFTEGSAIGRMTPTFACVAPKLILLKPTALTAGLGGTTCTLGRVTVAPHARGARLVAVAQTPAPGSVAAEGAAISVTVGPICSPPQGPGYAAVLRALCNSQPLELPPLAPEPLPASLRSLRAQLQPLLGGTYRISFLRGDTRVADFRRAFSRQLDGFFQTFSGRQIRHSRIAGRRVQWQCGYVPNLYCVYGWHEGGFAYIASGGSGLHAADVRALVANTRIP